jgi:hypothetical protein
MTFPCLFCAFVAQTPQGIARHTRATHNKFTRNQISRKRKAAEEPEPEEPEELSSAIEESSAIRELSPKFPVREDFASFLMVQDEGEDEESNDEESNGKDSNDEESNGKDSNDEHGNNGHGDDEDGDNEDGDNEDSDDEDDGDEDDGEDDKNDNNEVREPEMADNIVYEQTGGRVFDSNEARARHAMFIQQLGWEAESDIDNPLHPWKHEGEIWLVNLLFRDGNVPRSVADELLGAFASGRISMRDGPIQFKNTREMMQLLDVAAQKGTVCSRVIFVMLYGL